MAKPQSKTTVSVLRGVIGIPARELAKLTGRSIHTIKSVESGRLALSQDLALKLSIETGVSAQWLRNGDPDAKPVNDLPVSPDDPKSAFTNEYFATRRIDRTEGRDEVNKLGGGWPTLDSARLCAVQAAAVKSGNVRLAHYRISKFLRELEDEFGQCKKVFKREMEKSLLWDDFADLFMHPDGGYDDKAAGEAQWVACGEPVWANYREFVPAFKRTHAKLAKDAKKRREKDNPQEPDIFPLLQWTVEAIKLISPEVAAQVIPPKEEMRASKARRRRSKSPA